MNTAAITLEDALRQELDQIEAIIIKALDQMGGPEELQEACKAAVLSPGKRLRPLLVLLIAKNLGKSSSIEGAISSVEYFHAASLIVDDLPCMDNAPERRNKPTLHTIFGEAKALLASFALITAAFGKIKENSDAIAHSLGKEEATIICALALEIAAKAAGAQGATGGQFLDIAPTEAGCEGQVLGVMHSKTVTLFEVSCAFGWLFGGGNRELLPKVLQLASHLGMAFQAADDIQDQAEDKAQESSANIANLWGAEKTAAFIDKQLNQCKNLLEELAIFSPEFELILKTISKKSKTASLFQGTIYASIDF